MSPDVNNPAFRALTFDELAEAYREQMEALLQGGVDILLMETVFDTLNAKAALFAAEEAMAATGIRVPLMLSVTVSDVGGRTLSGQALDAFLASVQHADIFSVGLNCSFGARQLKPSLSNWPPARPTTSVRIPMPDCLIVWGKYSQTADMAKKSKNTLMRGLYQFGRRVFKPHMLARRLSCNPGSPGWSAGGSSRTTFVNVGERCNVAGSRKFLRLGLTKKNYDEASFHRPQQVEDGA